MVELEAPPSLPKLPNPPPISTQEFSWLVVTPETWPAGQGVLFAVSVDDYQTLSFNMAEVRRWVTEAQWRLDYYTQKDTADDDTTDPGD
jgi:hypothetical protein